MLKNKKEGAREKEKSKEVKKKQRWTLVARPRSASCLSLRFLLLPIATAAYQNVFQNAEMTTLIFTVRFVW